MAGRAETTNELEYVHGLIVEDVIKYEADEVEAYVLYYVEPDGTEWEITEEEYIRLRGEFSADEIINELVKAKQQLSSGEVKCCEEHAEFKLWKSSYLFQRKKI